MRSRRRIRLDLQVGASSSLRLSTSQLSRCAPCRRWTRAGGSPSQCRCSGEAQPSICMQVPARCASLQMAASSGGCRGRPGCRRSPGPPAIPLPLCVIWPVVWASGWRCSVAGPRDRGTISAIQARTGQAGDREALAWLAESLDTAERDDAEDRAEQHAAQQAEDERRDGPSRWSGPGGRRRPRGIRRQPG